MLEGCANLHVSKADFNTAEKGGSIMKIERIRSNEAEQNSRVFKVIDRIIVGQVYLNVAAWGYVILSARRNVKRIRDDLGLHTPIKRALDIRPDDVHKRHRVFFARAELSKVRAECFHLYREEKKNSKSFIVINSVLTSVARADKNRPKFS